MCMALAVLLGFYTREWEVGGVRGGRNGNIAAVKYKIYVSPVYEKEKSTYT